jgi:hypothetical protein
MYFRPETIDAFQTDENERGTAVSTLTGAIDTNPKVALWVMTNVLGYEISDKALKEYNGLIAEVEADKEREADMAQQELDAAVAQPKPAPKKAIPLDSTMIKDLKTWCDMSVRFYGKGKAIPVDFECKALPEELAAPIRDKLRTAKSELDIVKAFEIEQIVQTVDPIDKDELKALIDAINNHVEPTVTRGSEEMIININNPQNVDVTSKEALAYMSTLTENIQQLGTAIKTTPQLAPIVNVNVEPTPVNIHNQNDITVQPAEPAENNITVQPTPVKVQSPKQAKVLRDADGRIIGLESK